ncbi:MAG: hypothetical protein ABIN01_16850 [Ferruginibacter sp.]
MPQLHKHFNVVRHNDMAYKPVIKTYDTSKELWFGLEARKVDVDFESDIYLIPLFGHTFGYCGVAIKQNSNRYFISVMHII